MAGRGNRSEMQTANATIDIEVICIMTYHLIRRFLNSVLFFVACVLGERNGLLVLFLLMDALCLSTLRVGLVRVVVVRFWFGGDRELWSKYFGFGFSCRLVGGCAALTLSLIHI